ncbi:MAG TPA: T9SS type A sorting domain-containing protein, partial [Bacteroidia bacterium]|nr:T9SS type A sorting domain-containing protein [Bacteroidia bacterium]
VQPSNDYAAFIDHSVGATSPFTSLAYDISPGPYNGNLYCAWDDLRNGTNNADIFLAKSTDDGLTWSTQRINDDTSVRNQILPTVAVDPTTGWVYVAYLDARLNTDNFDDTLNYYLAWSEDGGQTFQNVKVSNQANTLTYLHSDYMGLDANFGVAHLLWVSGTSATGQQTWTAAANQNLLDAIKNENAVSNSSLLFYPALPNPAIDFTTFDFQVPENSKVTLKISDLNGRTLAVPLDEMNYEKGRHQFCLNHHSYNLSPGIYIATLSTQDGMLSRKFEVMN